VLREHGAGVRVGFSLPDDLAEPAHFEPEL
jgi:hypothetical protein